MIDNFLSRFALSVKNQPNKAAILFNAKNYSYEDVNRLSNSIAAQIKSHNLPLETIIPLVLERGPSIVITMIGIMKARCAFLPISPSSPCSRVQYILRETQAPLFFCDHELGFTMSDKINCLYPACERGSDDEPGSVTTKPQQLAYVMYTSGSTGNPKGVMIEHQSMMNLFNSLIEELDLTSQETFLALTDYTFDVSLIELLMPLTLGASIVLTEHGTVADGKKIENYLMTYNISIMQATPLTWEILIKNSWHNPGNIKILVGGEKFKTSLANKLSYQKGNVWNVYGPTETSMWSMIYHLTKPIITDSVPLGTPLLNTQIKVVPQTNSDKIINGELYIGGTGLARGYLNSPALTQEKFIFDNDTRFYKTGDWVTSVAGNTYCFTGRKDEQLKFGGIRIEAGEIETTIENEPFIKKAVVKIHEQNDYYKTMAAYIEIDEEALFFHGTQIISEDDSFYMKKIYDETYTGAEAFESEKINTCGWQNSFTGEVYHPDELYESYSQIKKCISNANLDHILEVGCGTGSLMQEYLPNAKKVSAFEISKEAIRYMRRRLPEKEKPKVDFYHESLINLHKIKVYSCVIVNSVIQYLPSIKSLLDSLRKLIKATEDGGTIIIGDVRSLELLDAYLIIKHFSHHPDRNGTIPSKLFYKSRDTEIVLSPLFFQALKEQYKEISWVDIHIKHGIYLNELNFFRYDAVLHINKSIKQEACTSIGFSEITSLNDVEVHLRKHPLKPATVQNIPYENIKQLIHNLPTKNKRSISQIIKVSEQVITDKKVKLAKSLLEMEHNAYDIFIHYQNTSPSNYLQLLFTPKSTSNELIRPVDKEKIGSIHTYCREPFSPWLQKFCVEHVKLNVKKHVMGWVNPSIYIWVEKWPQTSNGKLDKKALDLPEELGNHQDKHSVLSKLQHLWLNITGDNALISEEFWTHGVSSISMYYFLATINETFHIHMIYHELHQYNTMEKVAAYIEKQLDSK